MPARACLAATLLLAAMARIALVLNGGQFYWLDEGNYETSRQIVSWLNGGTAGDLFDRLNDADYPLFKFIGVVPAAVEEKFGINPHTPALFFAVASVVCVWLVWGIAKRLGADDGEALLAAALLAVSNTFFYYARHLLPYDTAAMFALLAVYVGVRAPVRASRSIACGVLAGCAFLTYAGTWTMCGAAILIHVCNRPSGWRDLIRRGVAAGAGALLPIGIAVTLSAAAGGRLFDSFVGMSGTVNQGTFDEGWRLPFAYLWHAEHLLLIVWLVCMLTAIYQWLRDGSPRVLAGLIGLCAIYGALVACSVGLHKFVVYGRLARELVPFFCLTAATQLARLQPAMRIRRPIAIALVAAGLVAQGAASFSQPLRQWFPNEFHDAYAPLTDDCSHEYIWVYDHRIYPTPEPVTLPPHDVVAAASHPLQFRPYQYEGYTVEERHALMTTDITMRLVAVRR